MPRVCTLVLSFHTVLVFGQDEGPWGPGEPGGQGAGEELEGGQACVDRMIGCGRSV